MKKMLDTTQYIFNPSFSNIDFSPFLDFESSRLLAIINVSANQTLIYATGGGASSPTGGAFSGSSLTFTYNTAGMNPTDILSVIYDEPAGIEDADSSLDLVSGKFGLDVNLLNSSFGGTVGDVMPTPFQDNALSIGILNGGILQSPAMNVNNEMIVDITQSGTIYTNTLLGGVIPSAGVGGSDSGTQRVVLASDQVVATADNDLFITGTNQSAIQPNIISGSSVATDCLGYRSFSAQIVSTGTGGSFIFEGSNDNLNFVTMPVFNQSLVNVSPFITAITATGSQIIYTGSLPFRYLRIRIASTITAGTIRAYVKLSPVPFTPTIQPVGQNTATNLLTSSTVTGTVTATVAGASLSATTITDIAVASQTVTATSANIVTGNQSNMAFQVSVTGASGTNPTLDVVVQETFDGTNYFDIYHFPRITTVGQYQSPQIRVTGAGIRYVRTLGGTTPNFTNGILRPARQTSSDIWRNFINRTIDPNTLNSATPSYLVEGCDQFQLAVTMNAGGTAPEFKLQGSNDNLNWYEVPSTTLTATIGSTVQVVSAAQCLPKFVRAITATAGSGASLFCLCITGRGV